MDYISQKLEENSDPRVQDWFLVSSPYPTLILTIIYVVFIKIIGPKYMENRKPYVLKNTIILYNAFQVYLSAYIFYKLSVYGWLRSKSILCSPVEVTSDPESIALAKACWWYFIAKFTEFFDTIFFLLRKKYNQISYLHLIHHAIMPGVAWFCIKVSPGGTASLFGVINSFIHIIMYSYYMVAAMGPQYQKYLWWKKYITVIQLIQFIFICSLSVHMLLSDCNINKMFSWIMVIIAILFFVLFSNFYRQTYNKSNKNKQKSKIDLSAPGTSGISSKNLKSS